jgi:hypothetical protein
MQLRRQHQQQRQQPRRVGRQYRLSIMHAAVAPDAKYEDADYDELADEIRVSFAQVALY